MTDNLDDVYCPACGKLMTKIYMNEQKIYLDVCLNGCGGIFFDNREFRKFDRKNSDISELKKVYDGKIFVKTDESRTRICPVCKSKMIKNYTTPAKEIQVDDCYNCGSKFLDYGELEKIRSQDKNRRTNQASSVFEEKQFKALESAGFLNEFAYMNEKKVEKKTVREISRQNSSNLKKEYNARQYNSRSYSEKNNDNSDLIKLENKDIEGQKYILNTTFICSIVGILVFFAMKEQVETFIRYIVSIKPDVNQNDLFLFILVIFMAVFAGFGYRIVKFIVKK